jgi:hypothetical protein
LESEMRIDSHPVVVYSINPETDEMTVIQVTNLLAVPATFYELDNEGESDEVSPTYGLITIIGGRTFRLRPVPAVRVTQQADGVNPVLEVTLPWDQIEFPPKLSQQDKADAAPPEFKPDER